MKVIILAGGFGTRLRSVVSTLPKPMANINGKPFLQYLIDYYLLQNVSQIDIAVGYKSEVIKQFIKSTYSHKRINCIDEVIPLGTGGAIRNIIESNNYLNDESLIVINGDSFVDIDLEKLSFFHYNNSNDITLALFSMSNFDRYGSVKLKDNRVVCFTEKKFCNQGLINLGVYIIRKDVFKDFDLPNSFSFEEFISDNVFKLKIGGFVSKSKYFIDIGIPSDYSKAQQDFKEIF